MISLSFKKQNAYDRGRKIWKLWIIHQSPWQLFSLAGLWLFLRFCYFLPFSHSGSKGPPIPAAQIQWTVIN